MEPIKGSRPININYTNKSKKEDESFIAQDNSENITKELYKMSEINKTMVKPHKNYDSAPLSWIYF